MPVEIDDPNEWAKWWSLEENKRIAYTTVGNVWVSTVFLGIDHNFGIGGGPILFETMVFRDPGPVSEDQERYRTYEDALKGHEVMVEKARRKNGNA